MPLSQRSNQLSAFLQRTEAAEQYILAIRIS